MNLADPISQPQFYRDVAAKRLMAWVVDVIVVAILCVLILPFTAFIGIFFFFGLMAVVGFVYRVITLTTGSATWGMRLMAVELRDREGVRFDMGHALLHTIGYTVSWAVAPLQLISVILMATSNRGQGLTDMVIGSAMLNRRARD